MVSGSAVAASLVILGSTLLEPSDNAKEPSSTPASATGSPLAEYLGFGHDVAREEAQFARDEVRRQEVIVACMAEQGFTYVESPPDIVVTAAMTEEDLERMLQERDQDPNSEYVASLPAEKRDSFYTSLYGRGGLSEGLSQTTLDVYDSNGDGTLTGQENWARGCLGAASQEVPGVYYAASLLSDELEGLRRDVEKTETYRSAESDWVNCMIAKGFPGTTRIEIMQRQDEIRDLDEERVLAHAAQAEMECNVPLREAAQAAQLELEAQFAEDNRQVLETWGLRS